MSHPVIQVDRVSKQYRLGTIGGKRLVDDVNRWWARIRGKEDPLSKVGFSGGRPWSSGRTDAFWALKDVSLEVKQGEVLGIIGRNGAGKSTLLKILSRVTAPTSGEVRIKGRIASLLEVGTGFHPELTGRENIFLNGTILGMTKGEIRGKLDEIIAFAEIEKFIDTPVKRFSSGMYVRLAFAVAAHLEPEILIVDEVLAVGDVEFQRKCSGKIRDVARQGRTVLFVSHNMPAIQKLCGSCMLLQNGTAAAKGPTYDIVDLYLSRILGCTGTDIDLRNHPARRKRKVIPVLQRIRILDYQGKPNGPVVCGKDMILEFSVMCQVDAAVPYVGIGFDDSNGTRVFSVATHLSKEPLPAVSGEVTIYCTIRDLPLAPGLYRLTLVAGTFHHRAMDVLEFAVTLTVCPSDFFGCGEIPPPSQGSVLVRSEWHLDQRRSEGL